MGNQAVPSKSQSLNLIPLPMNSARFGNEAVEGYLTAAERAKMLTEAAAKLEELFDILQIDHRNDHNMADTPARVAKMFVEEILHGRYTPPPKITEFDNVEQCNQLIVTGPIEVRSTCAHHLMPIYGEAYIGVVPAADGKIIGLSKYDRIVNYFSSRFQIQEELVKQIERHIVSATVPKGLAVRISAVHMCKTHRGVRADHTARMVNSSYYGVLLDDRDLRNEFIQECVALQK
jgi:GTP cyclohydrolase I